ncbi:hypothetical protein [Glycomyces tenuis]|uniref:hypothetical protein n=1 Tax=Glycomyces tenuis TaxID=58116 RepID=UPI000479FCCE|nr:hypothetical protein [Glycomyces tenuis]
MSWDVTIMRAPREFEEFNDLPDDWEPPSLGSVAEVREVLAGQLPGITFDALGWGQFEGPGFSMEASLYPNSSDEVGTVSLYIRGGGEAGAAALAVARAFEARALDSGSGEWLTSESADESFDSWQAYRDRVVRESS